MPAGVKGLGHVGLYVRDLEVMKEFWGGFMGMTLTKCNENVAFFSADPEAVDHEIAVMRGSRPAADPHLVQQISLRVDKLDDVRDFFRRAKARAKASAASAGRSWSPCGPTRTRSASSPIRCGSFA